MERQCFRKYNKDILQPYGQTGDILEIVEVEGKYWFWYIDFDHYLFIVYIIIYSIYYNLKTLIWMGYGSIII